MKLRKNLLFCFLFLQFVSYAKIYETKTFNSHIRTVQLYPSDQPFNLPVINLNSNETLDLHFDDLSENSLTYYYTVVQCHADWTPTILNPMEYIDGFIESTIFNYNYSSSTKQEYIHYSLQFPNNDMRITKSGNYALVVYTDNIQNPIFTYRFMVVEPKINIDAKVAYARNLYDRDKYQDVTFSINNKGFNIMNPLMEITASVLQNDRWDNAVLNVKPYMIGLNSISYDYYNSVFLFPSGREFRQFDIRSLRFKGQGVRVFDVDKDYNQVYLFYDQILKNQSYNYFKDLDGKYYIQTVDFPNYETEADYTWVQFSLDNKQPLLNGNLYVVGEFNNWQCDSMSIMHYSENEGAYTTNQYLKQGLYNYAYVYVDANGKKDYAFTEGYYYNTANNYTILVYYTPFGERYDRLIGIKGINSITDR